MLPDDSVKIASAAWAGAVIDDEEDAQAPTSVSPEIDSRFAWDAPARLPGAALASASPMRSLVVILSLSLLAGCHRLGVGGSSQPPPPFDPRAALTAALQSAMSNESLGRVAARKGRLPETRLFGESMARESAALRADLAALAQLRNVPPPSSLQEKQVALRENLDILPGQVFDRGYSLAMVQDLTATISALDAAAPHDRELGEVGARHKSALTEQLKLANAALDRVGGSPFGFVP